MKLDYKDSGIKIELDKFEERLLVTLQVKVKVQ